MVVTKSYEKEIASARPLDAYIHHCKFFIRSDAQMDHELVCVNQ